MGKYGAIVIIFIVASIMIIWATRTTVSLNPFVWFFPNLRQDSLQ